MGPVCQLQVPTSRGAAMEVTGPVLLREECFEGKNESLVEEGRTQSGRSPSGSGPLLLALQEPDETALHLAVRSVDRTSLHVVDFLVQNR